MINTSTMDYEIGLLGDNAIWSAISNAQTVGPNCILATKLNSILVFLISADILTWVSLTSYFVRSSRLQVLEEKKLS